MKNLIIDEEFQLIEEERVSFLSGSTGIILTLLLTIKLVDTEWMRHLGVD